MRAQLLALNIVTLLDKWTAKMVLVNTQHRALFAPAEALALLSVPPQETTVVGVPLPPDLLDTLYTKLLRLQTTLKRRPKITHMQLLQVLCPGTAFRYERAVAMEASVLARMLAVDGSSYSCRRECDPMTNITAERYVAGLGSLDFRTAATAAAAGQECCPERLRERLPSIVRQHV